MAIDNPFVSTFVNRTCLLAGGTGDPCDVHVAETYFDLLFESLGLGSLVSVWLSTLALFSLAQLGGIPKPHVRPLGLTWKRVGATKPESGTLLSNEELCQAIRSMVRSKAAELDRGQIEFTQAEFDEFGAADLAADSVILVDDEYWQPVMGEVKWWSLLLLSLIHI